MGRGFESLLRYQIKQSLRCPRAIASGGAGAAAGIDKAAIGT